MSKTVVLAEKPSVARDIAKVLDCHRKGNGYLEGNKYIVTWALGHLVTLADPEGYDHKYKSWNLEDLPMIPEKLKLIVIKKTSKQFQSVKTQLLRKDVTDIVIATDAGREGELVARWILQMAKVNKPIKRLWISSATDKAVKKGFSNLRSGKEYENLFQSAVARAEADWIVGINATRALTCKHNAQLSCGRVQSPTLSMINEREKEIKSFKPQTYYGLQVIANNVTFTWQNSKTKETKIKTNEELQKLVEKIKGKQLIVKEVSTSQKKTFAPGLYDLTELQREANKRFNFSPKETLSIMQKLYEHHKIVTYPRTDSRYLSSDLVDTLKERLLACNMKPYGKIIMKLTNQPIKVNKSFVDDTKVSDHHAIIPTEEAPILSELSSKEYKIYELIVSRFLAVLLPPFEYEQTNVIAESEQETFIAKGKRVQSLGWKEVFQDQEEQDQKEEQKLPVIKQKETYEMSRFIETKGQTKPPAFFNEATLLSAMENPVQFMSGESNELKKTIGETGGLGTVATRADIIEKLFSSFLIEKKGKDIFITNKGKQLLNLVPEELKSPALTAEWEQKLQAISKGTLSKNEFMNDMIVFASNAVKEIKQTEQTFKHDNMSSTKCPDCGKLMLEVNGKRGKMLVCQDRDCGHRKTISQSTNSRCPNCFKRLELRGEGEGQIFVCSCGHREKLSTFKERRSKEKNSKVSKKDVQKYLKQQNKQDDEPFNNPFAEALAKLKKQ
ncbi:DNA topoisomerase III [Gottfriedia solisilvae]|uniref:DNA topoisomerase 3 n=1 Tax=Gottfriedia solisilvae TaxID=1516104 RepID=A0A8J3AQG0_9BACI|nr:DNA topoisomerase III [Gottfriedia solisilvae]GGI16950.1 DNA topoisomerase 3 [Gottfriedia solisilvae]